MLKLRTVTVTANINSENINNICAKAGAKLKVFINS